MGSSLNAKSVKDLIQELVGHKPADELTQFFRVISKVYIGQLVEESRKAQIE